MYDEFSKKEKEKMAVTGEHRQIDTGDRKEMIPIYFSRSQMSAPYEKRGVILQDVRVPNEDPDDHGKWQYFTLPAKMIRENAFSRNGRGMWARIEKNGTTTLKRDIRVPNIDGKPAYQTKEQKVPNTEIKRRLEIRRERQKEKEGKEEPKKEAQEEKEEAKKEGERKAPSVKPSLLKKLGETKKEAAKGKEKESPKRPEKDREALA